MAIVILNQLGDLGALGGRELLLKMFLSPACWPLAAEKRGSGRDK